MKVRFDFDSVITDSRHLKVEAARELYGLEIPLEDMKWYPAVTQGMMTAEQYRHISRHVLLTPEISARMKPVDEVLIYLPLLMAQEDVAIITNRGDSAPLAREWLRRQGLNIALNGIGEQNSKADHCGGVDMFVDDDMDRLEPMAGIVPHRFIYHWEYNSGHSSPGIGRVHSWKQIYDTVQRIKEGSR